MLAQIDTLALPDPASTSSMFNGVKLSARTMPALSAMRGGDWSETFVLSRDVVALSIGDVRGHGIDTFETMLELRNAVRNAARRGLDPARTLDEANRILCDYDPDMQATAILALLDTRRGTVTFANAGHPPPLMTGPDGSVVLEFPKSDLPLGIAGAGLPALHVVNVPANTLLVFYTDGVTEHERNTLRGEVQLHDAMLFAYQCSGLPSAPVIERQMFLMGPNRDDAAILTAWTPGAERPNIFANGPDVPFASPQRLLSPHMRGAGPKRRRAVMATVYGHAD